MEGDEADRSGADLDALEEVERRAEIVGHAGAQDVAVGEEGDDLARVLCADALQGRDDTVLHLSQRFAARETEATREDLNQSPFRPLAQLLQLAAAPFAVIDLQDARLDGDGQVQRGGQGLGRLQAAQERAGVDGGDGLVLETLGNLLGLLLSLFVQRDAGCAAGQRAAFGPCVFAVANQEEIGRARGFFLFGFVAGLAFLFVIRCVWLLGCSFLFFDQSCSSSQGAAWRLCGSFAFSL